MAVTAFAAVFGLRVFSGPEPSRPSRLPIRFRILRNRPVRFSALHRRFRHHFNCRQTRLHCDPNVQLKRILPKKIMSFYNYRIKKIHSYLIIRFCALIRVQNCQSVQGFTQIQEINSISRDAKGMSSVDIRRRKDAGPVCKSGTQSRAGIPPIRGPPCRRHVMRNLQQAGGAYSCMPYYGPAFPGPNHRNCRTGAADAHCSPRKRYGWMEERGLDYWQCPWQ